MTALMPASTFSGCGHGPRRKPRSRPAGRTAQCPARRSARASGSPGPRLAPRSICCPSARASGCSSRSVPRPFCPSPVKRKPAALPFFFYPEPLVDSPLEGRRAGASCDEPPERPTICQVPTAPIAIRGRTFHRERAREELVPDAACDPTERSFDVPQDSFAHLLLPQVLLVPGPELLMTWTLAAASNADLILVLGATFQAERARPAAPEVLVRGFAVQRLLGQARPHFKLGAGWE